MLEPSNIYKSALSLLVWIDQGPFYNPGAHSPGFLVVVVLFETEFLNVALECSL